MTILMCPSDADSAAALAALRPRGRAWRNGSADALAGSVQGRFFSALGAIFGPAERRICALIREFFCATANETLDWWRLEYALPDACDPFADVCDKVNALGDSTTDYAVAVAARHGWAVTIVEAWILASQCGKAGRRAGAAICGAVDGVKWTITVNLSASPSYVASDHARPLAGRLRAGRALTCPPDADPLRCLIRRIAPAHADLVFLINN